WRGVLGRRGLRSLGASRRPFLPTEARPRAGLRAFQRRETRRLPPRHAVQTRGSTGSGHNRCTVTPSKRRHRARRLPRSTAPSGIRLEVTMFTLNRRVALLSLGAAAALSLTGCAALNTVSADAQTFGSWPAGRQPGTFAFERLPSQQRNEASQASLEDAARGALLKAGFTESA